MDITVAEVVSRKRDLVLAISRHVSGAIRDFQKATGVHVSRVSIDKLDTQTHGLNDDAVALAVDVSLDLGL